MRNEKCLYCKNSFNTYLSEIKRGGGKYCSRDCANKGKPPHSATFKKGNQIYKLRKKGYEGKDNPNWKGINPKCRDCGIKINYYYERCKPCSFSFQKGSDNPNWRGGVTSINESIRKSKLYKLWRKTVFKRDGWTCVLCDYRSHKPKDIHADHVKPFSLFPELRLNVDNGRTLCVDCHKKTPTYGKGVLNWPVL